MSQWRREAIERFPELRRDIAEADHLGLALLGLWHDLFKPAYAKEPPDDETVSRVYEYAYWCLTHRNIDIRTAAILDFYEKLHKNSRIRADMPRWISQSDFDMLHFAWEYSTKRDFAGLRQEFTENKARIEKQKRAKSQKLAPR